MVVFVKPMLIGEESPPPKRVGATLQKFFIDDVQVYQNPNEFPLDKERWCREGGCQFAFDRDENAPLRCINCDVSECDCPPALDNDPATRKRYALQRFTFTQIYMLDLDLTDKRARSYGQFSRYHTLQYHEERELRYMEDRFMGLEDILFFYRTKCNGFRVAFETETAVDNLERFEELCMEAERRVEPLTPDGRFSIDGWFMVDRISRGNVNYRSHAYWGYPRVHNPIWLNPHRKLE